MRDGHSQQTQRVTRRVQSVTGNATSIMTQTCHCQHGSVRCRTWSQMLPGRARRTPAAQTTCHSLTHSSSTLTV